MVVPTEAFKFEAEMDPAECLDYQIQTRDVLKLLEAAETFTTWDLTFYPEAVALGLDIGAGVYTPVADGVNITVWFQVDPLLAQDPAFDGAGAELAMELSLTTSNNPARKRQRTLVLTVRQL